MKLFFGLLILFIWVSMLISPFIGVYNSNTTKPPNANEEIPYACDLDLKTNEFFMFNQCEIRRNMLNGLYIAIFNHCDKYSYKLGFSEFGRITMCCRPTDIPAEFSDTCQAKGIIMQFVAQWADDNNTNIYKQNN